jgi:hypothetical protein
MKKYFIASVVAVMAFAFAAFAASFTVNSSVLASGQGDVTSCGDADLTYTTEVTGTGDFGVKSVTIAFEEKCDDSYALLATFNHDLPPAGGSNITGFAVIDIEDGKATLNTNSSQFKVKDLEAVSILVKDTLVDGEAGHRSGVLAP